MRKKKIYMTDKSIGKFKKYLEITKESSENTVKKYLSDIKAFRMFFPVKKLAKKSY